MPARDGSHLRRVRVELADDYNFVGEVVRDYVDSRGRRTLLVEDNRGEERTVRPRYPHVEVYELDGGEVVGDE